MANVTIIIGLPCCGKTKLMKQLAKEDHLVYDDFFDDHFSASFVHLIKNSENVIIGDWRLCFASIFKDFWNDIMRYDYVMRVHLIFFENNVEGCVRNVRDNDRKERIVKNIVDCSRNYDVGKLIGFASSNCGDAIELDYKVVAVL